MNVVEEIYSRNPNRETCPYSRTRGPVSLISELAAHRSGRFPGIISEYKRRSPSGFTKKDGSTPEEYFSLISATKVAAFSVLTEPDYFNGSYSDISAVQHFGRPILDKDFVSSEEMVDNAYNAGADAILLILDFLETDRVYALADYARSLGMESLIEFHDLKHSLSISPEKGIIFGYNRRNLKTLKMEPQEGQLHELLSESGISVVLESGIDSAYLNSHDVSMFSGMLIGASILDGDPVFKMVE